MEDLTPKQQAFADEYIMNGGNVTQAAIKAGYSKKTAAVIGFENLKKPKIIKYINSKMKPIEKKRQFGVEDALNALIDILQGKTMEARSKQIDHLKNNKLVKDMTYSYTPDLESRIKALDLYFKYTSPLLRAQIDKTVAEASIAKNEAQKLSVGEDKINSAFDDDIGGDQ
ncbi:terminase small subunit [Melissococcus plutonius]|uniref:Phage terminase small subunit n=1 Tax=Melissococcus plutonius (strain ATCC 35311 / DSM 29964 / CIP 104052 / LMG 20360 / NCIMB 702443) TaxID=940190 RepID=F3YBH4_MELPT|nr:terminase small subunit [Melissococcus plutonius]KMT38982.1 terminase, small subunit [Melissococcus plutonius]MBB5177548.1 phage terminase small subunit [Melissococcus plutonius]BAK21852.1 phage terminase small subunit [Melissococcus plutonius ATCC 35311]BBD15615.1 phage terminase, small subunit [Melissococcus plutonius]